MRRGLTLLLCLSMMLSMSPPVLAEDEAPPAAPAWETSAPLSEEQDPEAVEEAEEPQETAAEETAQTDEEAPAEEKDPVEEDAEPAEAEDAEELPAEEDEPALALPDQESQGLEAKMDGPADLSGLCPALLGLEPEREGLLLFWSPLEGAETYLVQRRTGSGKWQELAETTESCWLDETTVSGTRYTYTVLALAGESRSEADKTGLTALFVAAPALSAIANLEQGVQLKADPVKGAGKYRFFRHDGEGWQSLGESKSPQLTDLAAPPLLRCRYAVQALSADGKQSLSALGRETENILIPPPALLTAENVQGGVAVSWQPTAEAESYQVYRRTGSGKWSLLGETASADFCDSEAKSNTRYSYTVSVRAAGFQSAYSAAGLTILYVAAPEIRGRSNTETGVRLEWHGVKGAGKYRIFRSEGTAWVPLADTKALSYVDLGAVRGQDCRYALQSLNAAGTAALSALGPASATGYFCPPPTPESVEVRAEGLRFCWQALPEAEGYQVLRRIGSGKWQSLGETSECFWLDTVVQSNTKYSYSVRGLTPGGQTAFDAKGLSIHFVAPPRISQTDVNAQGILLKWQSVKGAGKYRLFRSQGEGWVKLADLSGLSYTDKSAVCGTAYRYALQSVSGDGKRELSVLGGESEQISFYPPPRLLSAECLEESIRVSWEAVPGVERYLLLRKNGKVWEPAGETGESSLVDRDLGAGGKLQYTVRCLDAAGRPASGYEEKGVSASIVVRPLLLSLENLPGSIQLKWRASKGAAKYRVYRKSETGEWLKAADVSGTVYTEKKPVSGERYTYTVCCLDGKGRPITAFDEEGLAIRFLAKAALKSIQNGSRGVDLSWSPVPDAEGYRVFRKSGKLPWSPLADTAETAFTDETAQSGTAYSYTVAALSGDSLGSRDDKGKSLSYVSALSLRLAEQSGRALRLEWTGAAGAAKYRVFRRQAGSAWKKLGDVTLPGYIDRSVRAGEIYFYTVRCLDKGGKYVGYHDQEGLRAVALSAPSALETERLARGVKLSWPETEGAESYRLYRREDEGGWALAYAGEQTLCRDETLRSGSRYTYVVRSVRAGTESGDGGQASLVFLAQPLLLSLRQEGARARLCWEATPGAADYQVLEKRSDGWAVLGSTAGTDFSYQPAGAGSLRCSVRAQDESRGAASSFDQTGLVLDFAGEERWDRDAARALQEEIQARRAQAGLAALSESAVLQAAAEQRAMELAESFGSQRPGGGSLAELAGGGFAYTAENIYRVSGLLWDAPEAAARWMNAASYRENLLSSSFSALGVGVYRDPVSGECFAAAVFAG